MIVPSDSSLPVKESASLAVAKRSNAALQGAAVPVLITTLDWDGTYLSFYWQDADRYGIDAQHIIGRQLGDLHESFGPLAIAPFLQRIRWSLEQGSATQFQYPFRCGSQVLMLNITLNPVWTPTLDTCAVTTIGEVLQPCTDEQALRSIDALPEVPVCNQTIRVNQYQTLLTQVAWNIRRTLDLATIWQQTVDGLGQALNLDRCLMGTYEPEGDRAKIVAEFRQPSLDSLLGKELILSEEPHLLQTLETLKPITGTTLRDGDTSQLSILAVATCYQDQPNGLIILHQIERPFGWKDSEIELIREFADQVGTGIAHARLLANSHSLAAELQRANDNLMQQHQDLEEARRQAEEASRLKSEFLANTSHELRTPLNGMIGFLKLIMDGMADDPEEQEEFISEAYRSAVHLHDVLNDILDIAKIEAGKMQLDLNPVKLDDLLTDVDKLMRTQAQQKNLSFEIRTPATRDAVILKGNYQRLLQVMLNLINNAIKFTHEGGVTITAEVVPKKVVEPTTENPQGEEISSVAKISVADTGIGVSLEKQDKLFQSFSQVDGSRTRQYGGTGLGLAISQKLVEAMKGVVNFYSLGEGLGSTVTFTVPLFQDPVMIASQPADEADLQI